MSDEHMTPIAEESLKLHYEKKGKIEISFASEEEFERLLAILTDEPEDGDSFSPSSFRV